MRHFIALLALATTCASLAPAAQTPEWVWFQKSTSAETRFFRKILNVTEVPSKAELTATADDELVVFLDGEPVLENKEWGRPAKTDLAARLRPGRHVLAVRAKNNDGSAAGLLVRLELTTPTGKQTLVSDPSWKASSKEEPDWAKPGFDDEAWAAAKSLGRVGIQPWGDVLAAARPGGGRAAARREAASPNALDTLPGFKIELTASATPEEGSWVAMTRDDKGRLIISPQFGKAGTNGGLIRLTLDADGKVVAKDRVAEPIFDAQGLCFHKGALYIVVNKYSTTYDSGLYRARDTGDGRFSDIQLLRKIPGGGEHGPHAVVPGPDGMLYVMAGNHTKTVENLSPASQYKNFAEDHVLPRQWDAGGHAVGILAPGGWMRMGRVGNCSSAASATATTSTSMPTAKSSPTTATWNGNGARTGIAPRASITP
jgi:hypothetical protein